MLPTPVPLKGFPNAPTDVVLAKHRVFPVMFLRHHQHPILRVVDLARIGLCPRTAGGQVSRI